MIEKIFSIFLLIISMIGYHLARSFENGFMIDNGLGAGFFPKVVCIVLGILSLIMFIRSFKSNANYKFCKDNKNTFVVMGLCIIYLFLMQRIGYLLSTIIFSLGVINVLDRKKIIINIMFSVIFTIGIYYLFSKVFNVSLPTGIL
ncbi:tripartite tricarboxylate transporter TctB family protein [Cetobacterium sp. ZWU0022]|uniref:tripartite tricarboxylate transporter TctB family protein n=1 Tax=Cetobacterium sp. ZWU0022 TaxID=1340502 RepID=UPI00064594E2|nr:tripartite tricarboxylate transporter TctB family protein [Cetobacterium sp. ZWU0022]